MESILNPQEEVAVPTSTTAVEIIDLDGNSSVDELNGVKISSIKETGSMVVIDYIIPNDESAPAVMFALMGGANISQILTHRINSENVATLTIRHNVEAVSDWEIKSYVNTDSAQLLSVFYVTESSVLLGSDFTSEVTKRD